MAEAEVPKTCKVITAETIAKGLLQEVSQTLQLARSNGGSASPCLAAFLANDDPAAAKYAEWSRKTCQEKSVSPSQASCHPLLANGHDALE